jgi:hypothetical protein
VRIGDCYLFSPPPPPTRIPRPLQLFITYFRSFFTSLSFSLVFQTVRYAIKRKKLSPCHVAVFPAIFHSCRPPPPPTPARDHAEKNASCYLFMTRSAERVSRMDDTYLFVNFYLTCFMNSVSFPMLSFLFYSINISTYLAFQR